MHNAIKTDPIYRAGVTDGSTHQDSKPEELLTPHEIAEIFKVPVSWVYSRTRNRKGDKLPHIRLGKYIRFYEDDVRRYLDRQKKFSDGHASRR